MKTRSNRNTIAFLFIAVPASFLMLTGCGSKSDPAPAQSPQAAAMAMMTASGWKMSSVMVDGVDKTSMYSGLALTFTSTAFSSLNGGGVWPPSGTWTFTSTDATAIKRNDGLEVTLIEMTDTSMKMGLTWTKTTLGPGRVTSISGQHVFSFGK